ncbi:hypothetical protein ElyMa_004354900 [Elysia marginata]|uniref:G-protein coupled receptors family 2 profile 1 domain-containing protein n=1 Tax=Elysia marginata TaxID=1093978 RepID=A0AAV4H4A7_9GAST|nr:hypothetical protein ElyMa_004354900 [Elysia marginata]
MTPQGWSDRPPLLRPRHWPKCIVPGDLHVPPCYMLACCSSRDTPQGGWLASHQLNEAWCWTSQGSDSRSHTTGLVIAQCGSRSR